MEALKNIEFTNRYWIIFLPLILMAADILSGWIQATVNGNWDSSKMRVGLYRKSGEILAIIISYAIYTAINLPIDIPVFIAGYIIVMELISITENLNLAGLPVPAWITKRLKEAAEEMSEDEPAENEPFDEDNYWLDDDELEEKRKEKEEAK